MEGQTVGVVGKIIHIMVASIATLGLNPFLSLSLYLPKLLFQETIPLPWQDAWILVLL
jgi:hypothetical protein